VARELEFERPIRELEQRIEALTGTGAADPGVLAQVEALRGRAQALEREIFGRLTRWQRVQVARHPQRPYALDYLEHAFEGFVELHGDRCFGDDAAIVAGPARLGAHRVMVVGHQKGRSTQANLQRNFGMPRPEGYRKALRLMRLAERFGLPVVSLIDTPGAYPGLDAEARGQAQAIAEALEGMAALRVPVIAVVTGEGGSGGALAIGVANRVLMLEHAVYSVISPEGCASILFKDASRAPEAADALRLTAVDLLALGVVDEVIPEPIGGAHRDVPAIASTLAAAVGDHLNQLVHLSPEACAKARHERFRRLGVLSDHGRFGAPALDDRG
jgi:acetyl-CoA carboxylase carboxyl transferase subunit alpha